MASNVSSEQPSVGQAGTFVTITGTQPGRPVCHHHCTGTQLRRQGANMVNVTLADANTSNESDTTVVVVFASSYLAWTRV